MWSVFFDRKLQINQSFLANYKGNLLLSILLYTLSNAKNSLFIEKSRGC